MSDTPRSNINVAVVDSGVANFASVLAALHRLDVPAAVTSDPKTLRQATHVVLPGVGSAVAAMDQLNAKDLTHVIQDLTQPVLGICLGMQLMFEGSDEGGGVDCLGVLKGSIKRLYVPKDLPIPHMGWNKIVWKNASHPLAKDVGDGAFVYFVHSFAADISDHTLAVTTYGSDFTSVAGHKNFFGCQFHPERSSTAGNQLLKNFLDM